MRNSNKFAILCFISAALIPVCMYYDLNLSAGMFIILSIVCGVVCYDETRNDMRAEFVDYDDDGSWGEEKYFIVDYVFEDFYEEYP